MFCYHCGCLLSEHDYCTNCGADVSLYKKIMAASNLYYNEGLERASVRDLTGAVTSLRQSLKFNKGNIEARNLLGLVYFEMGEVVAALSEWVISKNMRPEKNIADDYIQRLQSNAGRLDSINQTIKKYNQALACCQQGNKDVAIIQLKKVLSLNPKFIRAHQLLALLYMDSENWERAQRELNKCMDVDRNNTMTLRYLKEVEHMLQPDENGHTTDKKKKDEAVRYVSDNEMIIQPVSLNEPKGGGMATLFNVLLGLIIGAAAVYFLVLPAKISGVEEQAQVSIKAANESAAEQDAKLQELEKENSKLVTETSKLQKELEEYVGSGANLESYDAFLSEAAAYISTQDKYAAAEELEKIASEINVNEAAAGFQSLYSAIYESIAPEVYEECYTKGRAAYDDKRYEEAVDYFKKAEKYNSESGEVDGYFFLARAYHRLGDKEDAIAYYQKVVAMFPDTERATKSLEYIDDLNN